MLRLVRVYNNPCTLSHRPPDVLLSFPPFYLPSTCPLPSSSPSFPSCSRPSLSASAQRTPNSTSPPPARIPPSRLLSLSNQETTPRTPSRSTNVMMMNMLRCEPIYCCCFPSVFADPCVFSLSARPEPIEVAEPTSFLPVLDFGSPPKSSKRLPPPPPPPQRKLRSKKSHHPVSTFLALERLEDIQEEREDGFVPPVPSRRRAADKRIAGLWDFNRFSILQQAPPSSDAKSMAFDTASIFSNTSEGETNDRFSFPLPPNTIPRQGHIEDQLSPLDPDATFHALLSPLSPVSPATSGSCYSPPSSGVFERFTPMTPAFSFNNTTRGLVNVAPDDKSLSRSVPHTSTSPSHLSVQPQRPCPSPDLDPELCAHSSGSSFDSDENDALIDEPEDLDEFKIIPRLFGSWSFDVGMGNSEEYSPAGDTYEDARWDRAIDEVFAMVRSRRPSAQSEFGCIPDATIPPFDMALARKLSETWPMSGRAAPTPHLSTHEQQLTVAPLNLKKPEKPRPAPLVTTPFYLPPARLTAADSPDFDRPPPTQALPSAAFSPMSTYSILSPTSASPFAHPINIDSWPVWSPYEPHMDRRPSASALSLISKFSDDSIDIKVRRRRSSRRSKLGVSTARPTVPSKSPAPPSAWFNRATNGVGSSFTRLNSTAAQAPKENKGKSSSRPGMETVASPRSSSPSSPLKDLKGVLRKSHMPLEASLHA